MFDYQRKALLLAINSPLKAAATKNSIPPTDWKHSYANLHRVISTPCLKKVIQIYIKKRMFINHLGDEHTGSTTSLYSRNRVKLAQPQENVSSSSLGITPSRLTRRYFQVSYILKSTHTLKHKGSYFQAPHYFCLPRAQMVSGLAQCFISEFCECKTTEHIIAIQLKQEILKALVTK